MPCSSTLARGNVSCANCILLEQLQPCSCFAFVSVWQDSNSALHCMNDRSICLCKQPFHHADLYSHPDYQYLVRHKGQPNLSLFGGSAADITPANLLNKLMTQWSEEEDQQSPESASSSSATAESCFATADDTLLSTTTTTSSSTGFRSATAAAAGRRGKGGLRPSADAVSMANTGCRAVPGMSPAEYREALYSTWMTGRPWGIKHMPADSDDEVIMTQPSEWKLACIVMTCAPSVVESTGKPRSGYASNYFGRQHA